MYCVHTQTHNNMDVHANRDSQSVGLGILYSILLLIHVVLNRFNCIHLSSSASVKDLKTVTHKQIILIYVHGIYTKTVTHLFILSYVPMYLHV